MQRHEIHDEIHNEIYYPDTVFSLEDEGFTETGLTCPACLAFERRAFPRSVFRQGMIIGNRQGQLRCATCGECFSGLREYAERGVETLMDALDDMAYLTGPEDLSSNPQGQGREKKIRQRVVPDTVRQRPGHGTDPCPGLYAKHGRTTP